MRSNKQVYKKSPSYLRSPSSVSGESNSLCTLLKRSPISISIYPDFLIWARQYRFVSL